VGEHLAQRRGFPGSGRRRLTSGCVRNHDGSAASAFARASRTFLGGGQRRTTIRTGEPQHRLSPADAGRFGQRFQKAGAPMRGRILPRCLGKATKNRQGPTHFHPVILPRPNKSGCGNRLWRAAMSAAFFLFSALPFAAASSMSRRGVKENQRGQRTLSGRIRWLLRTGHRTKKETDGLLGLDHAGGSRRELQRRPLLERGNQTGPGKSR
jgi:hypothetical protein